MTVVKIPIRRLPHGADMPLPAYATAHSAGLDLCAAVGQEVVLQPGERRLVPTGFAIALPAGYEGQVRSRSGLALRHGITVLNAPGTIDADYRGEIGVLLVNLGDRPFVVSRNSRIAQLVIAPCSRAHWHDSIELEETERGTGGFGSTGTEGKQATG